MANPTPHDRKSDRADDAARLPISATKLEEIGESATDVACKLAMHKLGLPEDVCGTDVGIVDDLLTRPSISKGETVAKALIPFIANDMLLDMGITCRVVTGSAIWSVGPGDRDLFDHGVRATFGPEQDAACGNYHIWLEIDGHTVDLMARLLPSIFAGAARTTHTFSTPPSCWRRFPATIVHPRGAPMPDPYRDPTAPYAYREGSPALSRAVTWRVLCALADIHAALTKPSAA